MNSIPNPRRHKAPDTFDLPQWHPSNLFSEPPSGVLFSLPALGDVPTHIVPADFLDETPADAWKIPASDAADDEQVLRLPPLPNLFDLTPAPTTAPDFPALARSEDKAEDDGLFDLDLLANESKEPEKGTHLTWEAFYAQQSGPARPSAPQPAFLSEASSAVLDAVLAEREKKKDASFTPAVARTEPFLRSLLQLGLGRSSTLFPLVDGEFVPSIANLTVTGHSLASCTGLIESFLTIGRATLGLRQFIAKAYSLPSYQSVAVSLARAMEEALGAVEEFVMRHEKSATSLLTLQAVFQRPQNIVFALRDLAQQIQNSRNYARASLWLNETFKHARTHEDQQPMLRRLFRHLLDRVALPVLEDAEGGLGVGRRANLGDAMTLDSSALRQDALAALLSPQEQRRYEQTALYAEFIQRDQPDHPAVCPREHALATPEIQLCFEWEDVERAQAKAREFERQLVEAIEEYSEGSAGRKGEGAGRRVVPPAAKSTGWDLDEQCLTDSIRDIGGMVDRHALAVQPSTTRNLYDSLFDDPPNDARGIDAPSISLVPSLTMTSILASQHRILSPLTLHSIIHRHHLTQHLQLHHAFSLFQSGTFAHRLSTVLFSPAAHSAERQTGSLRSGGTMGLRLGSGQRRAWPPASSEIRLALRGVLEDAWADDHSAALPGSISFSIRNVPEEAIPGILDPHSLHALDFLQLAYAPPAALAAVFTADALASYDAIFLQLVRLLRIRFTVLTQIPLDLRDLALRRAPPRWLDGLRRLQHMAIHVVSTLVEHFLQHGIHAPWAAFAAQVASLAAQVASPAPAPVAVVGPRASRSLAELVLAHERTAACMAGNLLLRRRQRRAAETLEVWLADVLSLGRVLREGVLRGEVDGDEVLDGDGAEQQVPLKERFETHLGLFLGELVKLGRRVDVGEDRAGDDGARSAAHLLQRLDGGNGWVASMVGGPGE